MSRGSLGGKTPPVLWGSPSPQSSPIKGEEERREGDFRTNNGLGGRNDEVGSPCGRRWWYRGWRSFAGG